MPPAGCYIQISKRTRDQAAKPLVPHEVTHAANIDAVYRDSFRVIGGWGAFGLDAGAEAQVAQGLSQIVRCKIRAGLLEHLPAIDGLFGALVLPGSHDGPGYSSKQFPIH